MEPITTASETTATSLVAAIGDQCAACAAPLAGDQRYCLNCGERRGAPRLPFMDGRTRPATAPEPPHKARRGPRASAGATLVAGIATLLLAMGVGVLIGKSGHDKAAKATPAVQVVTVPGGGAAASAATTGTTATTQATATTGAKTKKASHGKSKHANAAANKDNGGAKKAPPPTVTVGSPGHGKGYKNGRFTGDFFGQ
jgi:hypothetical protein